MNSTDTALLAKLVGVKGRPFNTTHKDVTVRHNVTESASSEDLPGDSAFAALCYAWAADVYAHPQATALLSTPEENTYQGEGDFFETFSRCVAGFAAAFRAHIGDSDGRLPLQLVNDFGRRSLSLRRQWAWSIPNTTALDALQELSPLLEVGSGTGYWASLLHSRGVPITAYDSSTTWLPEFNTFEDGSQCAVPTTYFTSLPGGPEAAGKAEHQDKTLVLMWPDFMGSGTFGLEALKHYKGKTLALVGEWAGATYGVYAEGLQPSGQSFSPLCQQYVEHHFELLRCVPLPNWPLCGDSLRIYRRKEAPITPPLTTLQYSIEAGRYLISASPLPAQRELLDVSPVLSVISKEGVTVAGRGQKYLDMYASVLSSEGGLNAFYGASLQCHGDCSWLEDDVYTTVTKIDASFADGGERAHEFRELLQVVSCYHYNGFGGVAVKDDVEVMSLRVFPSVSYCNHSCAPNAAVAPNKGTLTSTMEIPASHPITISYLEDDLMLSSTEKRKQFLKHRWGFDCGCTRCTANDTQEVFYCDGLKFEKFVAKEFCFTDEDGDAVMLCTTENGEMFYSINGEARPASRHIRFEADQRELWFPDLDRCVTLPDSKSIPELYTLLSDLVSTSAVTYEGIPMRRGCGHCGSPFCIEISEKMFCADCKNEVSDVTDTTETAKGLLAKGAEEWGEEEVQDALRFSMQQTRHWVAFELLKGLVERFPESLALRIAVFKRAETLAGWDGGIAAVHALLADLSGACAEAAFKAGEEDLATEMFNKQHTLRALNEAVDPQWAHVAACQPNAQVLSFLYKD